MGRSEKKLLETKNKVKQSLSAILHSNIRSELLSEEQKALLHWSRDFAVKQDSLLREYSYMSQLYMWTKLVQQRVQGLGKGKAFFEDIRLQDILSYKNNVINLEKEIDKKTEKIYEEQEKLKYQYLKLSCIKQNREAAGTLQMSFGKQVRKALADSYLKSLQNYFSALFSELHHLREKTIQAIFAFS